MFILYQAHLGPQIWLDLLGIELIVNNNFISMQN